LFVIICWGIFSQYIHAQDPHFTWSYGGIIRADQTQKMMSVIFTGGDFADAGTTILDALKERNMKGSFFVTGGFIRTEEFQSILHRIVDEVKWSFVLQTLLWNLALTVIYCRALFGSTFRFSSIVL